MQAGFVQTVRQTFGERGEAWLNSLPALLADFARIWALTILPPFPNLSFNYVAPVVCADGAEAVLKAGVPNRELRTESAALRLYDGGSMARLLKADDERGVLLLERLQPGVPLTLLATDEEDDKATVAAASVMRGLRRSPPPDSDFPTVANWARGMERLRRNFGGEVGPFPVALVEEAERLFAELLASQAEVVLLHGDLHHENILSAAGGAWRAIDPKGVIGEPAYEVGALLRNLWEDRRTLANPARILERRIAILSEELETDRARIRGWGVAQAVLSAWWSIEDGGDPRDGIAAAELLAAVPG